VRGFDPLEDAIDYGRELIPATRERIARIRSAEGAQGATTETVAA
jgi:alkanesulfonate monooxygenase